MTSKIDDDAKVLKEIISDASGNSELKAMLTPAGSLKMLFQLFWLSIKSFFVRVFVLLGFSFIVAAIVYYIFRDAESWAGPIAAGIAFLVDGIAAVVVSFQTAIVATVIRAVEKLGLGKIVFDLIFSRLLGKDPESAGEAHGTSQSFDGLTTDELREKLNSSAASVINDVGVGQKVPGPVRWLSKKVFSIATWGVVRGVMAFAAVESPDGENRLDMNYVRTELGSKIDKKVADDCRGNVNSNVRFIFGGILVATLLIAWFVRQFYK